MKLSIKNIFQIFLFISISAKAQNKPDEFLQPTMPGSLPGYSFSDFSNLYLHWNIYNYDRIYVPRQEMTSISTANMGKTHRVTNYYNGWGSTLQSIERKGIGFDDIVTPFDQRAGFESYSFPSYPVVNTNPYSEFQRNPFNSQIGYYNTTTTFSTESGYSFGASKQTATNNVVTNESFAPGLSLIGSNRGSKVFTRLYSSSSDGNFTKWSVNSTGQPQIDGIYNDNEITIKISEGQHNAEVRAFYDRDGRVLAKKIKEGTNWLETWYVYNDLGQLQWIIPPAAVSYTSGVQNIPSADMLRRLCHRTIYNKYGQVIEKYVPDKATANSTQVFADYIVYDYKHRPVLYQSPLLRAANKWSFVIYDQQGRTVMNGLFTDPEQLSRNDIEGRVNALNAWPGSVTFQPLFTYLWGGFNGTYPSSITNCEIHQYVYYDRYSTLPAPFNGISPYYYPSGEYLTGAENIYPVMNLHMTKGLPVATKTKVLDPSNSNLWVHSVYFYDKEARLLQTHSLNPWNSSNQWDMSSNQYNFSGQVVLNILQHYSWTGANKASTKLSTKYTYNVNNGTLLYVHQKADNGGWREIDVYDYDKLGRVKRKTMGAAEQQNYNFNIRGQLAGINADHVYNNATPYSKTFGEIVCYDFGFNQKRYDGSITGYMWRGSGTNDCPRAYGYSYDGAGRLTKADFTERVHPNGPIVPPGTVLWKNTDIDYSVSDITYDANGNMGGMKQKGMGMVTSGGTTSLQPVQIDNLTYTYSANSNKLTKVADPSTYHVNDFLDGTNTDDDYDYDENGNMKLDRNKGLTITYNHLNKPLSVTKGSDAINNIYDGNGNLLQKTVVEGGTTTTYRYWGPFVYKNNKLQHYYHLEGRSRWLEDSSMFKDDFFVRDHLGNVRTIVTADVSFGLGSFKAGFEIAYANVEESIFDNIGGVRELNPSGTPQDLMSGMLHGAIDTQRIGAALLVKVMAGDKINLKGYGYYENDDSTAMNTYSTPEDMLTSLINTITNGTNGLQNENLNIPGLAPGTVNTLLNPANYNLYDAMKTTATDPAYPRAYLNYLVFDEQMGLVVDESEVIQLRGGTASWALMETGEKQVPLNGYVLAYFSNESNMEVYVDNEHLINIKGRLLQEQHYYPHGLLLEAPITASPTIGTNHTYQTKSLQPELGMELHDFHARQYDAQIGRFCGVDPLDEFASGYTGMGNDPANLIDPTGMSVQKQVSHGVENQGNEDYNWGRSWTAAAMRSMSGVFDDALDYESLQLESMIGGGGGGVLDLLLQKRADIGAIVITTRNGIGSPGGGGDDDDNVVIKLMKIFGIGPYGGETAEEQKTAADNRAALQSTNQQLQEGYQKIEDGAGYIPLGTPLVLTTNAIFGTDPTGQNRSSGEMLTTAAIFGLTDYFGGMAVKRGLVLVRREVREYAQKLFLSESFGITSKYFGSSVAHSQGSFNKPGRFFKAGWSNYASGNAGGMYFRIGFGVSSRNSNQAVFHIGFMHLPNRFTNPSIGVKRSLYNLSR